MVGGRDSVKIRDVTRTAEVTGLPFGKVKNASVRRPAAVTTAVIIRDRQPKR
jgi:hypothetical protein